MITFLTIDDDCGNIYDVIDYIETEQISTEKYCLSFSRAERVYLANSKEDALNVLYIVVSHLAQIAVYKNSEGHNIIQC